MNSISLLLNPIKKSSQLINYQTVRWRRPTKPFWLGVAKSKRFRIPQPKFILSADEKAHTSILNSNYRAEYNSLMKFIRTTNPKLANSTSETGVEAGALEKEISKSYENNVSWNAESARRRDERLKKEREEAEEAAIELIQNNEEIKKRKMELIEEVVRKEKILSTSYVTPENLDEAIENCLNNVENFDFAIDLKGNRYPGSSSLSRPREDAESARSAA